MNILFFLISSERNKQLVFLNTNLQKILKGVNSFGANSKFLRGKSFPVKIGKSIFKFTKH